MSFCRSSPRPGAEFGLALLLAGSFISACAVQTMRPDADLNASVSQNHYERLAMVKTWRMHGKLAVRYGDDSWQVGLRWRHSRTEDSLQVFDLMGRQVLDARGNQDYMQVRDSRGNHYPNVSTADFIEELIGRAVPPASLSSWVLGQAWPRAEARVLAVDAAGRIVRMRQLGWTIHYSDYRRQAQSLVVPGRIVCENAGFQLTVLSHDWHLCLEPDECRQV